MRLKLNVLEFLKKGSGIHIKKENRGKFTDYCGGKVTSACIAKGKNSSDPAVRKRATFALNSRRWSKHKTGGSFKGYPSKAAYEVRLEEVAGFKKGGVLKALEGSKVDPLLINGLANGIMNFATTFANNKILDELAKAMKALNEQEWSLTVKEIIKLNQLKRVLNFQQWMSDYQQGLTLDNPSLIVANHFGYNQLQSDISEGKNALKNKNALIDALTSSLKGSAWVDAFGGLMLTGLGMLGNYLNNDNKSSNNKTSVTQQLNNTLSWWNNPTITGNNNLFKNNSILYNPDKFWNIRK